MQNGGDKMAISDYRKSLMISTIDVCSSSGGGEKMGGNKNDTGKSTAMFGG